MRTNGYSSEAGIKTIRTIEPIPPASLLSFGVCAPEYQLPEGSGMGRSPQLKAADALAALVRLFEQRKPSSSAVH